MKKFVIGIALALVVLAVGGYYTYQYVKERPPDSLIHLLTARKPPPPLPAGDTAPLIVPDKFIATIFSRETPAARVLLRDPAGTLIVSETGGGKIVALEDTNKDGESDGASTVLQNLNKPHGMYFNCPTGSGTPCKFYVAEEGALSSYDYDSKTHAATNRHVLLQLPTGSGHFTRTLEPLPDGKRLLIAVGSDCNVCNEKDPHRAAITAFNMNSGTTSVFAMGLRNTVFMAENPITHAVWGTENGRDLLGDDIPPDEVNVLEEGKNYGWPICYGKNVHDTDFDKSRTNPCMSSHYTPAFIDLQAHSAPLGIAFIPKTGWPSDLQGDLLVAYHGSWNRGVPTGYKVVRFDVSKDGRTIEGGPYDFVTGFLAPGAKVDDALGRPVGLLAEQNGVVYVSDDDAGAVYRISRTETP